MIRSLIATLAAILVVIGLIAFQRVSRNSTSGTLTMPTLVCATATEEVPRQADADPTLVAQTESSTMPCETLSTSVARDAAAPAVELPRPECSFAAVNPVQPRGTAIETLPERAPAAVQQTEALSPRVGGNSVCVRTTDAHGSAVEMLPAPSAGALPPEVERPHFMSNSALGTNGLPGFGLEKPAIAVPVTAALPRLVPGKLRWISRSVAVAEMEPVMSSLETSPAPATIRAMSAESALPSTGTVVFDQKESPNSNLETLPLPRPVRVVPTEDVPKRVVSDTVFEFPAALRMPGMFSLDADGMLWLSPNRRRPTLVSSTAPVGTQGIGDTLGDEHLNRHVISGTRIGLGYWWTTDNPWVPGGKLATTGVETRFMSVTQRSFSFTDDNSPTLVRPFFDRTTGTASGVIVATPGLATGTLSGSASESLWGLEANLWHTLQYDWPGTTFSIEGMVGLRYLNLNDGIRIGRVSSFVANPVGFPEFAFLAGNRITEQESFSTQNRFIGGQLGIRGNLMFDTAIVTGQFQLAVGGTNEQINIQGNQLRTLANGQSILSQGALLALPSNIGRHSQNKLTAIPELGVKVAVPINGHVTLGVGFTTLYWSRLARPADQVDQTIDSRQVPSFPGAPGPGVAGAVRPGVLFNQTDLWLMGALFSVEVKW